MIAIFGVTFSLTLGLGVLQGRSLLARIDTLIDTARLIGAGRLHRRIPLTGHDDEFDELAQQLNVMLERIVGLMDGMHQVSDNVAHDLRRPLSRVRNLLDVTSIEVRDADEYRRSRLQRLLKNAIAPGSGGFRTRGQWTKCYAKKHLGRYSGTPVEAYAFRSSRPGSRLPHVGAPFNAVGIQILRHLCPTTC